MTAAERAASVMVHEGLIESELEAPDAACIIAREYAELERSAETLADLVEQRPLEQRASTLQASEEIRDALAKVRGER